MINTTDFPVGSFAAVVNVNRRPRTSASDTLAAVAHNDGDKPSPLGGVRCEPRTDGPATSVQFLVQDTVQNCVANLLNSTTFIFCLHYCLNACLES